MKKVLKILWSLILLAVIYVAYVIYAPISSELDLYTRYLVYHIVLAPLLVGVSAMFLKRNTYLIVPITALIFIVFNSAYGIFNYYRLLEPGSSMTLIHTISYTFGTNGENIFDFILQKVLFFIWLTIFTITYYVFELERYMPKVKSIKD